MLLASISAQINRSIRFKLHPTNIVDLMDSAQRYAFDQDLKAFLYWDATLTPKYYLEFLAAGYVSAIVGDIGKTVTDGTSTGTLVSYNNTTRKWLLTTSSTWTNSAAVTITTGTGAGTLIATAAQTGYVGPYSYPTTIPVRKMWGVTAEPDTRIYGSDTTALFPMNDFDFIPSTFNRTALLKPARWDDIGQTYTFIDAPSLPSTVNSLRWVYWRNPPTITGTTDETQLIIPAAYHMNLINAAIVLAQLSINGENVDPKVIQAIFQPWWNTLSHVYVPMGNKRTGTLNPGQASSLMI